MIIDSRLPRFLLDMLHACPRHGDGVHNWLFRCARHLHAHRTESEIFSLLKIHCSDCGRLVPDGEIHEAVSNSRSCAWAHERSSAVERKPRSRKWPRVKQDKAQSIINKGPSLAELWELSPIRLGDGNCYAEEVVGELFPGNPLLCVGLSARRFCTRRQSVFLGELARCQLIVPSCMSSVQGQRKGGGLSEHSLDNTGGRRFLVVEFDEGGTDEHAALLWHLSGLGPMVMTVQSGNKSLHGWFYAAAQAEEKLMKFMRYAVSLGADPATWTKSQFVRLPDGMRDNGNRQSVIYFNPCPIKET